MTFESGGRAPGEWYVACVAPLFIGLSLVAGAFTAVVPAAFGASSHGGVADKSAAVPSATAPVPEVVGSIVASRVIEQPDIVRVELKAHRTSALQPLERQMTLRAQELLAQTLCRHSPKLGTRLVANLRGAQVVHVVEREGLMELRMEAPMQTPTCEIRLVTIPPRVPQPAIETTVANPPQQGSTPSAEGTPPIPGSPITVQRSKGDY